MFAPAILPIQITFFVLLAVVIVLPLFIRRFTKHPIAISVLACLIGGLPVLFAVGAVVDSFRYGEFAHENASELNDGYVELPHNSTNIVLHKYASGHELKFKTDAESLSNWMSEWVNDMSQYAADVAPFELDDSLSDYAETEFLNRFGDHGWAYPSDAVVYRGWRSGRGGGFDVWFSENEQTAYISGSYW